MPGLRRKGEEAGMSASAQTRPSLIRRLGRRWRERAGRRNTVAALDGCGPTEAARIARELGVGGAELRVLAGKWPDSSDLLSRRMKEIKLDVDATAPIEAQVLRDLQRVCTLCASKRTCQHDLVRNPSDPAWREYCPNATTLTVLAAERGIKTP
jgi:hypothetical protein